MPKFNTTATVTKPGIVGAFDVCGKHCGAALARRETRWSDAVVTALLSPLPVPPIVVGFALLFYLSLAGLGTSFIGQHHG